MGHCPPRQPLATGFCRLRELMEAEPHTDALTIGVSWDMARADWSEHPQAEQVLLKKLHQESMGSLERSWVSHGASTGKQSFGPNSAPKWAKKVIAREAIS